MANITDVAKRAGVSKMTVSRVLNHSVAVKPETRLKVEKAIAELSYRPSMVARGLATGKTKTLAHVMIDIDDMIHVKVNKGFEEVCYEKGYSTVVCDANTKNREETYIDVIIDKKFDGAVFHHLDITEEQIRRLEAADVRSVLIDNERTIPDVSSINSNGYHGGYIAAEHLIKKGHTKLGCLYGVMSRPKLPDDEIEYIDTYQYNIWRNRTRGFCDALRTNGLKIHNEFFFQADGTMKHGFRVSREIVKKILKMTDRPTALFCENDVMAMGVLNALLELKLDVPETFAVVGFDGIDIGEAMYPKLTTVEQPFYDMGKLAASMIIDMLERGSKKSNVQLNPCLVERDTT